MNKALIRGTIGAATATALAISAIAPATAAPVLSNTAAVKAVAEPSITDVRWGWGGWLAAGIIGGLAFGALATAPYYSYGYSYPAYGYGYGPYYGYGYAPYYGYGYAPSYGYGWGGYRYAYAPRYYRYGARRYVAPRHYAYRHYRRARR